MKSRNATERLLLNLSKRLSSRSDCKGVEYKVQIESSSTHTYIHVQPCILGYPSIHKRGNHNLQPLLKVVIDKSDLNTSDGVTFINNNGMNFVTSEDLKLVDGKYQYVNSVDKKHRKWMRII